jgi:hypothetical protein
MDLDTIPSNVNPFSVAAEPSDVTTVALTAKDDVDVTISHLASDEATIQPSMGSSRISGGILRGRAFGNVPKHADITTSSDLFGTPVKGEVYLYVTEHYPRHVKFELMKGESDLVVMVKVVGRMAPILDMVARKFSIIQSECIYFRILS